MTCELLIPVAQIGVVGGDSSRDPGHTRLVDQRPLGIRLLSPLTVVLLKEAAAAGASVDDAWEDWRQDLLAKMRFDLL